MKVLEISSKNVGIEPTRVDLMLVQIFVENLQFVPTPYLRDKTPPSVESGAFDLADDLRLRPILESERTAFYHYEGVDTRKSLIPSRDIESLCCVIEATTVSMSFDSHEVRETLKRVKFVWLALLLYFARICKVRRPSSRQSKFIELGLNAEWAKCTFSTLKHVVPVLEKLNRPITYQELEEFRQWWLKFESLGPKPTFLLNALDRFGFATGMYSEGKDAYQFVDYVSALEALIGESVEAQYKLSLRTAVLLGDSNEDHQNVFDFMKKAYDIRSDLVHGRWPDKIAVRKSEIESIEALGRLHSYSRRCIWRVIALLILLKEAPESETKTSWLKLNSDHLRQKITGLLDYCLIRDDIRKNLMEVLSSSSDPTNLLKQYDEAVRRPYYSSMLDEKNQKASSGNNMEID